MSRDTGSGNWRATYGAGYYASTSDGYYEFTNRKIHHLASVFVSAFGPKSSLDIGCAHGIMTHWLRMMGVEAYGTDISGYAFSMATDAARPYLIQHDIDHDQLPFGTATLDLVTAFDTLEHLTDLGHALSEISRVLKPGGYLYVTTPLPFIDSKGGQFLLGRGYRRLDDTHVNVHSRTYWKKIMRTHGFHYCGVFAEALKATPTQFCALRALSKLPWGNVARAYLSGVYLFQRDESPGSLQ